MADGLRVTVWNEGLHERDNDAVREIYPEGMGKSISDHLKDQPGIASVRTAALEDEQHGLGEEVLQRTDVLLWWAHLAHDQVSDAVVDRVHQWVLNGMGLIVLHSSHYSKIFQRLMGTSGDLKWREARERERIWVVDPGHPIADGLPEHFEIEPAEMYGEPFDIPQPDQLVFISWFQGGEVFRSGCCWHRGRGKVFYFRPGHETYPVYHNENVLKVIHNAVRWAAPAGVTNVVRGNREPLEPLDSQEDE